MTNRRHCKKHAISTKYCKVKEKKQGYATNIIFLINLIAEKTDQVKNPYTHLQHRGIDNEINLEIKSWVAIAGIIKYSLDMLQVIVQNSSNKNRGCVIFL